MPVNEREIRGEGKSGLTTMMRKKGVAWRQRRLERGSDKMERSSLWLHLDWWTCKGTVERCGLMEVRISGGVERRSEAQWR